MSESIFIIGDIEYNYKDYTMHLSNNITCPICYSSIVFLGYLVERNTDKKEFYLYDQIDCRNYHYSKNRLCKYILIEKNHGKFDIELIKQFKQIVESSYLKNSGFKFLL